MQRDDGYQTDNFDRVADEHEHLLRNAVYAIGIPAHAGIGLFQLIQHFLVLSQLEVQAHGVLTGQFRKVIIQAFLVFLQLGDGKLADGVQQEFAADKDARVNEQLCQVPPADQLVDDQGCCEDGDKRAKDIAEGLQRFQREEEGEPFCGHREHEADNFSQLFHSAASSPSG